MARQRPMGNKLLLCKKSARSFRWQEPEVQKARSIRWDGGRGIFDSAAAAVFFFSSDRRSSSSGYFPSLHPAAPANFFFHSIEQRVFSLGSTGIKKCRTSHHG